MPYTSEQIRLIDNVADYFYEYYASYCRIDNPTDDFFAKTLSVDTDTAQWAINMFCKIGDELGILKASKSGYGYYHVVNVNNVEFTNFKNDGGFKKYFNELSTNSTNVQNIVLENSGTILQSGNQSSFSKINSSQNFNSFADTNEMIPVWKKILNNPWTIAIFGGIIVAFIAYYFHWTN